jgi:integrase/recombinase XerD
MDKNNNMDIEKEISLYLLKAESQLFELTTVYNYKASIKKFLKHFEAKENPSDITLEEFKIYLELWDNANTRYSKINAIKSFYRLMEINSMNFDEFDKPRRVKKRPNKINEKFLLDCINEIDNRKHKAIIALAYASGMWIGEMLNLKLSDIDFDKNIIIVRNIRDAKKTRIIKFSSEINEILTRYIKKFAPVEYLFNGHDKIQFSKEAALNAVHKNLGKQYNFHLIRNTHIYNLIESGVNLNTISKHLGFSKESGAKRLNFFKIYTLKETKMKPPL